MAEIRSFKLRLILARNLLDVEEILKKIKDNRHLHYDEEEEKRLEHWYEAISHVYEKGWLEITDVNNPSVNGEI